MPAYTGCCSFAGASAETSIGLVVRKHPAPTGQTEPSNPENHAGGASERFPKWKHQDNRPLWENGPAVHCAWILCISGEGTFRSGSWASLPTAAYPRHDEVPCAPERVTPYATGAMARRFPGFTLLAQGKFELSLFSPPENPSVSWRWETSALLSAFTNLPNYPGDGSSVLGKSAVRALPVRQG